MKKNLNIPRIALLSIGTLFFIACSSDDSAPAQQDPPIDNMDPTDDVDPGATDPEPTGQEKSFPLASISNLQLVGTAKFIEIDDNSITVEIEINNAVAGGEHPAHIHVNTAVEGGDIAISLTPVNGDTGMSSTNFNQLDDGTAITYAQLLDFDGYINIHNSVDDLGTLVAQGDVGQNELTGVTKSYGLDSVDDPEISGTATFAERVNGEALAVIVLVNTPAGGEHPGHIHMNSAAEGGGIAFTFNPVSGDTGLSGTNISMLDDGTAFGYADVLTYNGYINIHASADDLGTLVAQGDIGSNVDSEEPATINYDVTNQGASAYIFNGNGLTDMANPDLTLKRGETYTFTVSAPGHPFLIKSVQSTNTTDAYDDGVTNNGIADGTIMFTVPMDAPDTLFYNCEFHSPMTGELNIID